MRVVSTVLLLLLPASGAAQVPGVPPPPRGDVAGTAAWLHVPFDGQSIAVPGATDWTHHLLGTVTAGVYWTDHWKTEVSVGQSNNARAWDTEVVQRGGDVAYRSINHRIRYTQLALAQAYQFRRNEWIHPHLGAGVLVERRTGESEYLPAVLYRGPAGQPLTLAPGEQSTVKGTRLAPFVTAGMKAYFTPSGFFRTDLRIAFRDGIGAVSAHAGFGVDF